ncbi:MAG TPA: hypothetical protein VNO70_08595, partial [Blastocatellia bacterium]|nr:hypothetical protein [Blastocatellia bacterium]
APGNPAPAQDPFPAQLKSQLASDANAFASAAPQYLDRWDAFLKQIESFRQQPTKLTADKSELTATATNLKRDLAGLKRNLDAWINKLRSAGKFNEALNAYLLSVLRRKSSESAETIAREGGALALLTETSAQLGRQPAEIDRLVNALADGSVRSAQAGSLLLKHETMAEATPARFNAVAHRSSAPAFRLSFKCFVLGARLLIKTFQGTDTQQDVDDFNRQC